MAACGRPASGQARYRQAIAAPRQARIPESAGGAISDSYRSVGPHYARIGLELSTDCSALLPFFFRVSTRFIIVDKRARERSWKVLGGGEASGRHAGVNLTAVTDFVAI